MDNPYKGIGEAIVKPVSDVVGAHVDKGTEATTSLTTPPEDTGPRSRGPPEIKAQGPQEIKAQGPTGSSGLGVGKGPTSMGK